MTDYDVAIIGGGTAGYAAALRAVENNLKVALIEKDKLGGTCLHRGCIPTKALIESSSFFSRAHQASGFGVNLEEISIDWPRTQQYKKNVVNDLYSGLVSLVKARPVGVIEGEARFASADRLSVNGQEIKAKNIVIAAGSYPKTLPNLPESGRILNSDRMLEIQELPKSLTIIGGGYIGIEFGSLFNELGTEVTIVEVMPQILPEQDRDICSVLASNLRDRGVRIETNAQIDLIEERASQIEVTIGDAAVTSTYTSDELLIAVGRGANTKDLALENVGVELDSKGFVKVNENLQTNVENIFAIGDCINTPQLAHVSFSEGMAVADFLAYNQANFPNYQAVPSAIYSRPQIATVGQTEQQAKAAGINVKTAHFNFAANSRAIISQEKEGKAKIIADEKDNILGIHIVGADASNLISEAMLAVGWEAKVADLAAFIHPHPTFSEVIGEAALKLMGKPLHSL